MTLAIEISHLTKVFRGKRGARVEALTDLSLQLPQGEVFGFLGPNGAGKSTTIKTLMGLITPTSGQAQIFGIDAKLSSARLRVGYLPENPSFYDYLTAEEYLAFVARIFKMEQPRYREQSRIVLEKVDLWEARKRTIRGYSKGMVQRLGIAQALLHDPDLLIFDEPMSGLDPLGRALVKSLILDLKRAGKTILFSTHITSDVEEVCDRYGILVKGRLREMENVSDAIAQTIHDYQIETNQDGIKNSFRTPKLELLPRLRQLETEGAEIERITPASRNLEQIFLAAVAAGETDGR
jgi:ABC-2 type transport system ATP-binding protein